MLAVAVKLESRSIPVLICVANPRLKCSRKAQVDWQIQQRISILPADFRRIVLGAIVDHQIFPFGIVLLQIRNHPLYVLRLVVGRDDNQKFLHGIPHFL